MSPKISIQKVVITSFLVDLLDIILNLVLTLLTGSVVMFAEFIQGVSDLIASGALLIGINRPKREIYFWALMSALVILLFASILSFYFGLKRFLEPRLIGDIVIAYIALIFSVVTNGYAFFLSVKRIAKDRDFKNVLLEFWNSPLLMTKNTFVLDLMGMLSAIIGLIALILYQVTGNLRFDGLGAIVMGVISGILSLHLILDIKNSKHPRLTDGKI